MQPRLFYERGENMMKLPSQNQLDQKFRGKVVQTGKVRIKVQSVKRMGHFHGELQGYNPISKKTWNVDITPENINDIQIRRHI